jgi:chorismate-pyruvate lyase
MIMQATMVVRGRVDAASLRPDQVATRLKAYALLRALNAELLTHDSATLTLERWCEVRRLASPARIVAERLRCPHVEPSIEQRQLLGVSASDPIRYRRVRLRCGDRVMSDAHNWYVPARLTATMNRELDTTDVSFGRVVRSLNFRRRTLSSRLLWWPFFPARTADEGLGPDRARPVIPLHVLEHHAVLTRADGMPFSCLVETYTREVLASSEPQRRRTVEANDSIAAGAAVSLAPAA